MNRQIGGPWVSFAANFTEIGHSASVTSHVNGQITSRCASSTTSQTQILFLIFGCAVQVIA